MTSNAQHKSVLILAEASDDALAPITFELLSLAKELVKKTGGQVGALVFSQREDLRQELAAAGADQVYYQDGEQIFDPDVLVAALMQVSRDGAFSIVLLGHNTLGADLAPRLAFQASGSIATNCEAANFEGEDFLVTRVCYGGKARSVIRLRGKPAVITVRSGAVPLSEQVVARTGAATPISVDPTLARSVVLERKSDDVRGLKLETAKIVIAGGRGLGGPEGFKILEAVAQNLGAVVGASRVACDLGWCSPSMQIGLTGKTIAPDLYIAVGISGASQHMAGCAGAKTIVAINSDPNAPIFADANIGIVGDYKELMPKIAEEIGRLNS